jgi:undecaprenyl diphosphate synthase
MEVPNHLAVIIDGNRRWARKRHMPSWEGHRKGAKNLDEFFNWCFDLNIPQVSAWILSTENLNREKSELDELFKIFYSWLEKYTKKESGFFDKYQVRIRFIGDLDRLPPKLVKLMGKLMIKTAKYQKKALNILIAYGGQFELTEAMRKVAEKILKVGRVEITQKDIEENLMLPTPVDLIIRTGGYHRLSDFLLWQSAFAEIYVTKTLWPDFSKRELIKSIRWYNTVQRNFGR